MNTKFLNLEIKDKTAVITINHPETLNALNSLFFSELNSILDSLSVNTNLSALIITGVGKAFVAGADIAEMETFSPEEALEFSKIGHKTFSRLESLPYMVIAAVNGFALGGGCELALSCDIRISSSKAKYSQPEVSLGLIPGFAGTQRLSAQIGLGNALNMLMTGEMINAEEAYRMGLVQKLTEPENLMEEAQKIADLIKTKGPEAVSRVKKVTRKGFTDGFTSGSNMEMEEFSKQFVKEGKEGMKAFLEKRAPKWE